MRCVLFITALLLLALGVAPGHADKRVALVVGNDRYANLSANDQLQKAVNDARAVAGALRQIGFDDVISGENLSRGALLGKLDELRQRLAPGDTAFFFFSGHGVALDGVNYILPADVPDVAAGQETRLKGEALGEQYILSELTGRGVRVAVVVLDACRTNPFGRSGGKGIGGDKGLAPPPQVKGVFSLYAASNGQAARDRLYDGDPSSNSVFSRVLVPALTRPGLDLTALAFDVREEVARVAQTAGYVQEPAYYDGTIGGRVYLAGALPAREQPPREPPVSLGVPDAAQAWGAVQNTTSLAVLDEFLRQFGNSPFYGSLARARREELAKEQAKQPAREPAKPVPEPQIAAVVPPVRPAVPAASPCDGPVTVSSASRCGTIKVGILHSLSGMMAISETTLKDVMLMLIDEQNKKGGLLGRKLEAVVVDPASNWPLFAERARQLIAKDKVAAVFGGWTSVSRKSMLPVFKELNSILFYPVQYEGEESERNVFYTGAAPNQQAIPAVDYLMREEKVQRWVLEGTDYVYPRTTNKILEAYLKSKGVKDEDISINYTPFGRSDWQTRVAQIKRFGSAGKKTAVVSTINGDANVPFYKELGNQGVKATDIPALALSVGEEELASIDARPLIGHLAAWNYFESIKNPANEEFIKKWHVFTKNPRRTTNDPMEAHVIGFAMWVKAVEKAGTTDPDKVIDALPGIEAPNLTGSVSTMLPNHHITKPVFVGEVRGDGQFDVVWKSLGLVPGDAWSDFLPGSRDLEADWVTLKCGNYNTVTKKCGGS